MPQIKPVWEIHEAAENLVKRLCDLYPERLGHISNNTVGCVAITNKDKPVTGEDSRIRGVRMPEQLFCQKKYVITFFCSCWDEYSPAQRSIMLMKNLLRIPDTEDGPDGSVLSETLKDNRCLVKAFGVDYMENTTLPNLAESRVPLPDDAI
jgi:hypothetical protein